VQSPHTSSVLREVMLSPCVYVAENLDVYQPEIIILGTAGNVTDFVYDRRDQQFHTTVFGSRDERLATFGALATLLTMVLREQQEPQSAPSGARGL
jgi:hypothetical protein